MEIVWYLFGSACNLLDHGHKNNINIHPCLYNIILGHSTIGLGGARWRDNSIWRSGWRLELKGFIPRGNQVVQHRLSISSSGKLIFNSSEIKIKQRYESAPVQPCFLTAFSGAFISLVNGIQR